MPKGRPKKRDGESLYKAVLTVQGKKYHSTGNTLIESLEALSPGRVRTSGILSVEHDGKKSERILNAFSISRMFALSPITREIQLKNVSLQFGL